jgi:GT2 family glycosyltransferase
LYAALNSYNKNVEKQLSIEVFLVDDGCTDGTADAIRTAFADVHIIQGTGSLFWAGGMRLAWGEAYKRHTEWDFYLLLNDDTDIFPESFSLLIQTHLYSLEHYGMGGVYTGATCAKDNKSQCTYGGDVWINRAKGTSRRLMPSGTPQLCDMANANIMLIASSVVNKIGMLCGEYQHGLADYDYAIRARKVGIPVLLTAEYCGACDNDHTDPKVAAYVICEMSLAERRQYFKHPVHSSSDYLRFIRNASPMRCPMVWLGRMLNLYFPKFYYKLNGIR